MGDKEISSDDDGALNLSAKGRNGFLPDYRVCRGEVYQIAVVYDERSQIVQFARGLQQVNLGRIGGIGPPHSRTCGEDLKRVRAEFMRLQSGPLERAGG